MACKTYDGIVIIIYTVLAFHSCTYLPSVFQERCEHGALQNYEAEVPATGRYSCSTSDTQHKLKEPVKLALILTRPKVPAAER